MTGNDVVNAARSYKGVKFEDHGRTRSGMDCSGLLIEALKDVGYLSQDYAYDNYDERDNADDLERELDRLFDVIPLDDINPGDIVFYRFGSTLGHCGIVSRMDEGQLGIIHTYGSVIKVAENSLVLKWYNKISKVYRLRGLDG